MITNKIIEDKIINPEEENDIYDLKDLVKIVSDYTGIVVEDFVEHAKRNGIDIDLSTAKDILKGKNFALDSALNWDNSKSLDENLANLSGSIAEGLALVGLLGLAGIGGIPAFTIGVVATGGLNYFNISLGDLIEKLYKELRDIDSRYNSTQQEREGLAYQITNGDNSGAMYGAYNPNSSFLPPVIRRGFDPLILDLNADGIKTTSINDSKTFFDLSGDGMKAQSGWVSSEDGLLVYDKNNNGKIDDITELFGNEVQSGFSELKELFDANGDNLINDNDTNFSKLQVWQDINSDGISQADELKSLSELGISDISLGSTSTNIDSSGNTIKATSTFTQNGEVKQVADVDFIASTMLTNYAKDYSLTSNALILPWLRGYGTVIDSHVLYSIDESFADFTKDFISQDINSIYDNFDTFLKKWTQLDSLHEEGNVVRDTLSIDDKVWILENITGQELFKTSIENAYVNNTVTSNRYNETYINTHFQSFKARSFNTFVMQSMFKEAFNGTYFDINQDKVIVTDKDLFINSLSENYNNLNETNLLISTIDEFKQDLDLNISDFSSLSNLDSQKYKLLETVLSSESKVVSLFVNSSSGTSGVDILIGTSGNDNLTAGNGNDILNGEAGNDNLTAGNGDDILTGGTGDDTLNGSYGSDTYYFNLGDGADTINEYSSNTTDTDKIVFGAGISKEDISFRFNGNTLNLSYSENDTININNQKYRSNYEVEKFELSNGEYLTSNDIENITQQMNAYITENSLDMQTNNDIKNNTDLMQIVQSGWHN